MKKNKPAQQQNIKKPRGWALQAYQYKPGQSGNPSGRKSKGESLKEYAKRQLASMTKSKKEEFLRGLDKHDIWQMAEGRPIVAIDANLDVKVGKLSEIQKGLKEVLNEQNPEDSK